MKPATPRRLTLDSLTAKVSRDVARLNPHLFPASAHADAPASLPVPPDRLAPAPVAQRRPQRRPLAARENKTRDPAFYVVRVTSFRSRLIDTDNLVPKWHVDALRYAGVLPSDAPDRARIETTQQKCAKGQERTEIVIERITQNQPT